MDEALTTKDVRRRWFRFFLPGLAIVAVLIALAVFIRARSSDVEVAAAEITVSTAEVRSMTESARFAGTVEPMDLSEIPAPETGRVVEVFARSGDRVVAGQPLLRLSNPERELAIGDRMSRIRAELMTSVRQRGEMVGARFNESRAILQAERDRNEAAEELRRRETLLARDVVNEAYVRPYRDRLRFFDRVLAEERAANAEARSYRDQQVRALETQVAALRADYSAAAAQRQAFTIRVPVSGVLLGLETSAGQSLDVGDRIAGIDPGRGYKIVAELDEFYAGRVRSGLPASLSTEAGRVPLRVVHVSPDVREGSFRLELAFAGPNPPLRPGETLQGTIAFPSRGRFVSLPIGPYLEQTGGNWLFVLSPDGRSAERRPVRSGIRSSSHIAIQSGLRSGEQAITSSYRPWLDVNTIRIMR